MPNVTRIEDLPDLSDIETYDVGESGMGNKDPKMNKYIRNHSRQSYTNLDMNPKFEPYKRNNVEEYGYDTNDSTQAQAPLQDERNIERYDYEPTPLPQVRLNCLDVCNHIKDCPLCSKFYHNDNTLYLIIIVVLSILVLILTKKVLNL
jgi:hypothetical protein